ncbi:hypothetical protein TNCV_570281 [Trichonephila clavipes]|nr:hypothetical protein TNCV_570281 [Trichonephila clavipes]
MAGLGQPSLPPTDLGRVDEEMASPGGRVMDQCSAALKNSYFIGVGKVMMPFGKRTGINPIASTPELP